MRGKGVQGVEEFRSSGVREFKETSQEPGGQGLGDAWKKMHYGSK